MIASLMFSLAAAVTVQTPAPAPAAEGFIQQWLVMAPIPLGTESGSAGIDIDLLGDEGLVTPKAGDALAFGNKVLSWKPYAATDYYIDFLRGFGYLGSDYVAAYAVVYVWAEAPADLTLAVGTNDQGKAWVNGKEVFRYAEARGLDKDADRVDVTLVKGRNVLVLKVVNETNNWQACARFLKNGTPVTNLTFTIAPDNP
jgi:hypothetical protein